MNTKRNNAKLLGGRKRVLFLLPALVVYLAVIVAPALYSLFLSFHSWKGGKSEKVFVGLKNYKDLLSGLKDPSSVFTIAVKNNLIWLVLTMTVTISVALLLALLLNKRFRGRTAVRGALYFPYILSGVIVGMVWCWTYQPQFGLYNSIMSALGLDSLKHAWLADTKTSFIAIYVASMWHTVGQPMVLFLAGLQAVPNELIEAARIDGASRFQTFVHVTIPQLKETFFIVFATQFIHSLKVYDIVKTMTNGGPGDRTNTLATLMVKQTIEFANFGTGAAISWIMIAVLAAVIVPYVIKMSKD